MEQLRRRPGWDWNAWFWLDREEFPGGWKTGQCRYRSEKAAGRGSDGKLFLMHWVNYDKYDGSKFLQTFYEISFEEYTACLDRAIRQGEVRPEGRQKLLEMANAPFVPPWDRRKAVVVYEDGRYTLGQKEGEPYLLAEGKKYRLSCHPYEPCLYITGEDGFQTTVHNAFDPFDVLEAAHRGETITSITGREYTAKDFCDMVSFAVGMGDISFRDAEKVFGPGPKERTGPSRIGGGGKAQPPAEGPRSPETSRLPEKGPLSPEASRFPEDPFYELLAAYPRSEAEICIVKDDAPYCGYGSHRRALVWACGRLLAGEEGDTPWRFDADRAEGKPISTEALFAPSNVNRDLNYRGAFLDPPHGNRYTEADFMKLNAALFPKGTDELEAYQWTTDWSDYFDDGHEWWGALCLTVYDRSLDRFAVILASATD